MTGRFDCVFVVFLFYFIWLVAFGTQITLEPHNLREWRVSPKEARVQRLSRSR